MYFHNYSFSFFAEQRSEGPFSNDPSRTEAPKRFECRRLERQCYVPPRLVPDRSSSSSNNSIRNIVCNLCVIALDILTHVGHFLFRRIDRCAHLLTASWIGAASPPVPVRPPNFVYIYFAYIIYYIPLTHADTYTCIARTAHALSSDYY